MKKIDDILMILDGKTVGGAELQFVELANFLAENYRVRLLSLHGDNAIRNTVNLSERIELQVYNYHNKIEFIPALIHAWVVNRSYPARAIVTTSVIGNIVGYLLGCCRKVRLVSLQTVSKSMRHKHIDRFVLRRFHTLVAGAADIRTYLLVHLGERDRIEVIHNWVDFTKRGNLPDSAAVKENLKLQGKLVIGCIGRLHVQKGQIYLIDAFVQIAQAFPASVLLLVGGGAERSSLEARVHQLGLNERVIFAGVVKGNEYNEMFAAIDIYVQPSIFEGLPRTLLDAMYYGKPVIASDVNGNSEAVVAGENGILVPSANVSALVEAIKAMIHDKQYREKLGSAATRSVRENFEMGKQLTRIENILFEPLESA